MVVSDLLILDAPICERVLPCPFCMHAGTAGMKKKRVIKLSRKQLKRKSLKQERGDNVAGRQQKKAERNQRKMDRRLAAKELW